MRRPVTARGAGAAAAFCLMAGIAVFPVAAAAQRMPGAPIPPGGSLGLSYESYSFGNSAASGIRSVSLFTVPFAAGATLVNGLEAGIAGAFASGHLVRADGSGSSLQGLTDTQLSLTYQTPGGGVRFTAVGLLPTGHSRQSPGEADVAGIVAADVLPFRITNWGSGGGGGASLALARNLGATNVGVSFGYVVAARFQPLTQSPFYYRPGNQLHVKAAVDRTFGNAGKMSLAVSYQHFSDDQFAGANLYRSGDRLLGTLSYAFAVGARSSGLVYGGLLHRQHGTFLEGGGVENAQNLMLVGGALRVPVGETVIQPRVDVRALSQPGGQGNGFVAGAGASLDWMTSAVTISPVVMARFGSAKVYGGQSTSITGVDIGVGLRFGGMRR